MTKKKKIIIGGLCGFLAVVVVTTSIGLIVHFSKPKDPVDDTPTPIERVMKH